MIVGFCVAQFGLLAILNKGYSFIGYICIPLVILPTLIIGRAASARKRPSKSDPLSQFALRNRVRPKYRRTDRRFSPKERTQ